MDTQITAVKPSIEPTQVMRSVNEYFGQPVEQLVPIGTGQIASAFSFRVAGQDYIIRFVTSKMAMSFGKDQFAFQRLSSSSIPVPPIIYSGTFNDFHFAISRKVPGVPLDELPSEDYRQLIPAVVEMLDAISQIDIADTENWGLFDDEGVGLFPSWPDFLLSVAKEEAEDGFYGKWHRLFDETFLDRELFDHIYGQMTALLEYCPVERFLVHGDYGFGNILAEDGKITAVLDWANALYGDFVYDIAWLDLYSPGLDIQSRFQQYYQHKNRPIFHYKERLVCYQCHVGLDAQRWYAKSGQPKQFGWMRDRILHILEHSSVG